MSSSQFCARCGSTRYTAYTTRKNQTKCSELKTIEQPRLAEEPLERAGDDLMPSRRQMNGMEKEDVGPGGTERGKRVELRHRQIAKGCVDALVRRIAQERAARL